MTIKISRGGSRSNKWSGEGSNATVTSVENGVLLRGTIVYGIGETEVEFRIEPDSFTDFCTAMIKANRNSAIRAFGRALGEVND